MSKVFKESGPMLRKYFNSPEAKAIMRTTMDTIDKFESDGTDPKVALDEVRRLLQMTLDTVEEEDEDTVT